MVTLADLQAAELVWADLPLADPLTDRSAGGVSGDEPGGDEFPRLEVDYHVAASHVAPTLIIALPTPRDPSPADNRQLDEALAALAVAIPHARHQLAVADPLATPRSRQIAVIGHLLYALSQF